MNETSRAIPFVTLIDGKFQLVEEAVAFIESLPQPLAVIACAGAYRTGKSLFLNRGLLQVEPSKGFSVGSSTNACTKGLWIHTSLLQVAKTKKEGQESSEVTGEKDYTNVLIIDTEGLGAFDANDSHDTKIFALALLLCSYFIYNSVGKIDEEAIGRLSLVCNVCKQVKANAETPNENKEKEEKEEKDDGDDDGKTPSAKKRKRVTDNNDDDGAGQNELAHAAALADFFPQFLWLLRDFSLRLEDTSGAAITARQYLETALGDKAGRSDDAQLAKAIDEKNQLRRMLRQLFAHRDCATLMRPCVDETQLQQLDRLGDSALRPEFLKQLAQLRRKILLQAPHKLALQGRPVSGRGLVQLARSYIDAFNRGAAPVIRDSWNLLVEVQCRDAVDEARKVYIATFATLLQQQCREQFRGYTRVQLDQAVAAMIDGGDGDLQVLPQTLEELLQRATSRALEKYQALCGKEPSEYVARLSAALEITSTRIRACNARGIDKVLGALLDAASREYFARLKDEKNVVAATKPLWQQHWRYVEDALQTRLVTASLTLDDAIMRSLVQRSVAARHEQWAQQVEEHWVQSVKRGIETHVTAVANEQQEKDVLRRQVESLRESIETLQQDSKALDAALSQERQQAANQKATWEAALAQRDREHADVVHRCAEESAAVEKEWAEYRSECEAASGKLQQLLTQSKAETQSALMQRDSATASAAQLEQRCTAMSHTMDQMHDENETLRERLKAADKTLARLRTCEADLQQTRSELARAATDFSTQLAQLERDSVASLQKIRSTNERTRKEQEERLADVQQQHEQLQTTLEQTRRSLESQLATLTDKLVQVRHDAGQASEKAAQELLHARERCQAAEQSLVDAQEERKRALQQCVARYEADAKQAALAAREEAKRVAAEKSELQRLHNEATTDAACLRVRNEHLQSKLQDEASRGELQQAKKDFERAAMLNDKLRTENDQLLAQQRAHQHELQERERRIEQVQKKMQEQEREFSAERLRLRLRIEEENAQQAYRKSVNGGGGSGGGGGGGDGKKV
jgi:hypothetical protein